MSSLHSVFSSSPSSWTLFLSFSFFSSFYPSPPMSHTHHNHSFCRPFLLLLFLSYITFTLFRIPPPSPPHQNFHSVSFSLIFAFSMSLQLPGRESNPGMPYRRQSHTIWAISHNISAMPHPSLSCAAPWSDLRCSLVWASPHPDLSYAAPWSELPPLVWVTPHPDLIYPAPYLSYAAPWSDLRRAPLILFS